MHYLFNVIRILIISSVIIFLVIITSGFILLALACGYVYYKYIIWSKKICPSCGKRINKKDVVCRYCNTIEVG